MKKSSKKQANHATRPAAAKLETSKAVKAKTNRETAPGVEPFSVTAQRLGSALADVIGHPNCPKDVIDAISELDVRIFNHCNDLAISLRHNFPYLLTGMLEEDEDE